MTLKEVGDKMRLLVGGETRDAPVTNIVGPVPAGRSLCNAVVTLRLDAAS
jgi:hypothetical protein